MKPKLSVIVPVYNEQDNLVVLYNSLLEPLTQSFGADFEIIFIDDGSHDHSVEVIEKLALADSRVKLIEFSRNFGKEVATTAGLNHCQGDAALIIDADMQHPPKLIPEFVAKWQAGADMVIGIREQNVGEGWTKKIGSAIFYYLINFIGQTKIGERATDFRLIDRKVIDQFNKFTEHNRITRGLLDWLGFKKDYVMFTADRRLHGVASYSPNKLFKLAITSFVSHSLFPLKFAGYLGGLIILFSGPLGLYIFMDRYVWNDPFGFSFTGTAVLAVMNLFLVGIILSCLGLIAMYIGSIQNEVMNRPIYVVRKNINFDQK